MESNRASGHGEHGQRQTAPPHRGDPVTSAELGRLSGLMEALIHEVREFKERAVWRLDNAEDRIERLEHRKDHTETVNRLHQRVEELQSYQDQRKVPNKWADRIFTSVVAGVVMLVLANFDWIIKVFS